MYKLHLILKYLRKRRIAWVSLIAVMLCTAMVLVVISVMGGWIRMFRDSFRGLSGDIIVSSRSVAGFEHYQEIRDRIAALPEISAAVESIRAPGLIRINNGDPDVVEVVGYPIERIGQVNEFPQSLYRQHEKPLEQGLDPPPPSFNLVPEIDYEQVLPNSRVDVRKFPGMIVGSGVVGLRKNEKGEIERPEDLLYRALARLEVIAMDGDTISFEGSRATANNYWIVDDSRTTVYQLDYNTVYVPFDVLQKDLKMNAKSLPDPDTGEQIVIPARATEIHIKVKPGLDLYAVKPKIEQIVHEYYPEVIALRPDVMVETWEEANALMLGAVEKEKLLVTFLFAIISVVAIFLIFCIFYMIVVEKTKDIGIIKSVGATSGGVAGIFLGYGLAIGIVGSGLGLLAAYLIVHNINEIHSWISDVTGKPIWDPQVYAFDIIPNTMDPNEVFWIMLIAVMASVLGALVPAWRAAGLNPVEALRWE